ncbi:hypothetical protein [Actinomadura madurae]|uniref:hypothetical protein n=1 Tax=Actinomadura madurae TaxID=1993 RepID=UPI002025EA09|nr:hypothetical protein [Actinomadura madurae]MCP9951720.1 hypothetical protein [Actinomadura madurae]MCP9968489.1 hypothetical protein [Actinomadura madurae]MCP9980962.1 hypothetical protein [Actinomadura madurae]MCQ0007536.1 hypothetical protein [Actinomadura madurae]URM97229.1 hypothetical protein LUW76_24335 [Actinomadura madurae]
MAKINEDGTTVRGPAGGVTAGGYDQGTITTTYGRLTAVFGPPDIGAYPDDYRDLDVDEIRYEWLIDTPDGPAQIHDWKTGDRDLRKTGELYEWRVGGHGPGVMGWIEKAVKNG